MRSVADIIDWLVPTLIGTMFTSFALAKFYGLAKGIVGGRDKPFAIKLCGM